VIRYCYLARHHHVVCSCTHFDRSFRFSVKIEPCDGNVFLRRERSSTSAKVLNTIRKSGMLPGPHIIPDTSAVLTVLSPLPCTAPLVNTMPFPCYSHPTQPRWPFSAFRGRLYPSLDSNLSRGFFDRAQPSPVFPTWYGIHAPEQLRVCKPSPRLPAYMAGNGSVIVHGYAYDLAGFKHPKIVLYPMEPLRPSTPATCLQGVSARLFCFGFLATNAWVSYRSRLAAASLRAARFLNGSFVLSLAPRPVPSSAGSETAARASSIIAGTKSQTTSVILLYTNRVDLPACTWGVPS
jgi:hypothetical protein